MKNIILLILILSANQVQAINDFYLDSDRGWYWHEAPPLEQELEPVPEPPQPVKMPVQNEFKAVETSPTLTSPSTGSVAWVKEQLPKLRDAAIDNPTKANVRKYLYMNRLMLDKAEQFSDVADYVATLDPYLMNRDKGPQSDGGKLLKKKVARQNTDEVMQDIADQAGLLFFYSSTCPYCHRMLTVIHLLKNKYNFNIKMISMDGLPMSGWDGEWQHDRGLAIRLSVQSTPATYLAKPAQKPEILEIGQGFLSLSEFTKIALLQAKESGWISDDEYDDTRGFKRVIVNTPIEQKDHEDPVEMNDQKFVEMVKRQLNLL
jgi:conjugal transfer pilus assembly protein TraF